MEPPTSPAPSFFSRKNGDSESLLLAEVAERAAQPELDALVAQVAQARLASSEHGTFTGERFFASRPEAYREIVELLAHPDVSIRRIAKVYAVSQDTVRAIARREGLTISAFRLRLRDACMAGALGLAERVADDPESFPKSSLPVALDVLARNTLLLDGQATEIVEHRDGPSIDAFNAYVDSLRTGQSGGNSAACGPPPAAGAALAGPSSRVPAPLIEVEAEPVAVRPGAGTVPEVNPEPEPRNPAI